MEILLPPGREGDAPAAHLAFPDAGTHGAGLVQCAGPALRRALHEAVLARLVMDRLEAAGRVDQNGLHQFIRIGMVTGPSLTKWTCMSAPNSPLATTACWLRAKASACS